MQPRSFDEFWPYYVSQHRHPRCRALHYVGTGAGLAAFAVALATLNPWLALGALAPGYGLAWIGHFLVEKNRPATFGHPLWSLAGDFRMLWYAVTGRMRGELARLEKAGFRHTALVSNT